MGKGGKSDDWECCEQCSYCFTIFIGLLFLLAGGAMAVLAAIFLFSDWDIGLGFLESLNIGGIQWAMFIIGLCIFGTALLGMISAGCAKCAANPDGKNDGCEKCCTACLSIIYIIILSCLIAASLVIAGFLSYYAAVVSTQDNCPDAFTSVSSPDAADCPVDFLMWEIFYGADDVVTDSAPGWVDVQDLTVTCGYYCDGDTCDALNGNMTDYTTQITGTFCTNPVNVTRFDLTQYTDGNDFVEDQPTSQAFRPTLYYALNTYLVPFLAVWWCIFVLAVLLVVAACVMCIRKSKTTKESTYKP